MDIPPRTIAPLELLEIKTSRDSMVTMIRVYEKRFKRDLVGSLLSISIIAPMIMYVYN
jgi:hypothetical protein